MDTNGKIISVLSKDSHFLTYGAAAVSKYFPMILGKCSIMLSFIVAHQYGYGIIIYSTFFYFLYRTNESSYGCFQ